MLIAICDDEALHREHTATLVRRELRERAPEVDCYDSAEALLRVIGEGDYAPDIAILDIEMGGMDGISLAKRLNELAPGCRVIFLTGYLSFAKEVYSAEHVYFIVKEEVERRIGDALRKATADLPAARAAVICAQGKQSAEVYPLEQLLYLERTGRKTRIVTTGGERLVYTAPAELLRGAAENSFIRCHQSFWVNSMKIENMNSGEFVLQGGLRVPISRGYRQQARDRFFELLG